MHHILADPVYAGTAYANRYDCVPQESRGATAVRRTYEPTCRQLKPREQWIAIPVPALVDAEIWEQAQAQLARNAALSFRNNSKYNYLLRCLLTCKTCGLAMFGRTNRANASQQERRYYRVTAKTASCPRDQPLVPAAVSRPRNSRPPSGTMLSACSPIRNACWRSSSTWLPRRRPELPVIVPPISNSVRVWTAPPGLTNAYSMPTRQAQSAWPSCPSDVPTWPKSVVAWSVNNRSGIGYAKRGCRPRGSGAIWWRFAIVSEPAFMRQHSLTGRPSCSW